MIADKIWSLNGHIVSHLLFWSSSGKSQAVNKAPETLRWYLGSCILWNYQSLPFQWSKLKHFIKIIKKKKDIIYPHDSFGRQGSFLADGKMKHTGHGSQQGNSVSQEWHCCSSVVRGWQQSSLQEGISFLRQRKGIMSFCQTSHPSHAPFRRSLQKEVVNPSPASGNVLQLLSTHICV